MLLGVRPWEPRAQLDSASPHMGPVARLVAKTMATHKPPSSRGEAGSVAASTWNPLAWLQIPALLVTGSPLALYASVSVKWGRGRQ